MKLNEKQQKEFDSIIQTILDKKDGRTEEEIREGITKQMTVMLDDHDLTVDSLLADMREMLEV